MSSFMSVGLCPDWEDWDPKNAKKNAKEAMEAAEQWLDVPQVRLPRKFYTTKQKFFTFRVVPETHFLYIIRV